MFIYLTNSEVRSGFATVPAQLVDAARTDIGSFVLQRVVAPAAGLYFVVIWPITCLFRQQRRCYVDGVYQCRKHPRRCFDCKFFAAADKAFVAVDKMFVAIKHVALYVKRKLQERFKREREPTPNG